MKKIFLIFLVVASSCDKNASEWQTILMRYNTEARETEKDYLFYTFRIDKNGQVFNDSYSRLTGFTFNPVDFRKNTGEIGVRWNGTSFDVVAYYIVDCQLTVDKLIEVQEEWFDVYIKQDHESGYALIQANGKVVEVQYTTLLFAPLELEPSLRKSNENQFTVYRK